MLSISTSSVNVSLLLLSLFFSSDKASCSHLTLDLVHILKLPYYSWLRLQMLVIFLEDLRRVLGKEMQTKLHPCCLHALLSTTCHTPGAWEGSSSGNYDVPACAPRLPSACGPPHWSLAVMQPPAETCLWGDYKWDLHMVCAGPMTAQ